MITSSLTGNIGDNIRAYLITRIAADKNGYSFGFNPHPEFDYHNGSPQMDFMNIDYGEVHDYKYAETPPWVEHIWQEKYESRDYPTGDHVDFHEYQPDVFEVPDNTKLVIRCCLDIRYYEGYRDKIRSWLEIRPDLEDQWLETLQSHGIHFDYDLCVLNVRGGEFRGVPGLVLRKQYWLDAIHKMRDYNKRMKFLAVSDDPGYVKELFDGKMDCVHLGIGGDFFMLTIAKNLILSNSGFAPIPVWLNKYEPTVIAPMYWSRHNNSDGYWGNSHIENFPFYFLDRRGDLHKNE